MQIELDNNDINIVLDMLSQGPFRAVAPVIQKIQMQLVAQRASQSESQPEKIGGTD